MSNATTATTINSLDRMKRKEKMYRKLIDDNQSTVVFLAGMLSSDIEKVVENAIGSMNDDDDLAKEIQVFLQQQRERLKALSVMNVENSREIDVFLHALDSLKADVVGGGSRQDDDDDDIDYDALFSSKIQTSRQELRSTTQLDDMQQEPMVRQVLEQLGEKPKYEEDDDELEVCIKNTNSSNDGCLKCPISGTWLEDPVKNKMCGHVYSKVAILNHIQSSGRHRTPCPVAGCINSQLNQSQLESDKTTEMQVRARRRQKEREHQERLSQMAGIDDDEEEMEMAI